jgi:hypothetical protein
MERGEGDQAGASQPRRFMERTRMVSDWVNDRAGNERGMYKLGRERWMVVCDLEERFEALDTAQI